MQNRTIDEMRSEELLCAKDLLASRYLGLQTGLNVVGVGVGFKDVGGQRLGYRCVRVYVNVKEANRLDVPPRQLIPERIGNIDTDVVDVGLTFSSNGARRKTVAAAERAAPGEPGSSIGLRRSATQHLGRMASGTLGAILDGNGGKQYIVSCNHVLAMNGHVRQGIVVSPAPLDRGHTDMEVELARDPVPVPLKLDEPNEVDCAAAEVITASALEAAFRCPSGQTVVSGQMPPVIGERVFKFGKASGMTFGTIVDVSADILVDYSFGMFRFTNQVLIEGEDGGDFASDGDSGAVVLADREQPVAVGMVFAPAGRYTAANPMPVVLERLREALRRKEKGETLIPEKPRQPEPSDVGPFDLIEREATVY